MLIVIEGMVCVLKQKIFTCNYFFVLFLILIIARIKCLFVLQLAILSVVVVLSLCLLIKSTDVKGVILSKILKNEKNN